MNEKDPEDKLKGKENSSENGSAEKANGKFFSSKPEDKKEEKKEANKEKEEKENNEDLSKKLAEVQAKYNETNDKYLRLYSDFDNFRKRSARERIDLIKYSEEELITQLLPVLDDFERAIKSNENSRDIDAIKAGIQLVSQKFKNILSQKGLKELEIKDGIFDSDKQEAITKIQVSDKEQKGKVIEVLEKGYLLNEKIIRHAKVVVGD